MSNPKQTNLSNHHQTIKEIFDLIDYAIVRLFLIVLALIGAWAVVSHAFQTTQVPIP